MGSNDKIASAKKAVSDMMFYYYYSLVQSGCEDPKKEIATELPKMIGLTEDQINYVKVNALQQNTLIQNLDSSIGLLSSIEESKSLDIESIAIVKGILSAIKEQAGESIDNFAIIEYRDKENE